MAVETDLDKKMLDDLTRATMQIAKYASKGGKELEEAKQAEQEAKRAQEAREKVRRMRQEL